MPQPMRPAARISFGALGVAVLVFGLWLSLISLIVGIVPQTPNPFVGDGDPCCTIPDTWAQTRDLAFWGWVWLGVAAPVIVTGVLLIVGGIRGRLLRWRWLPITVAAVMALSGVAIVIEYVRLHEFPSDARCRDASEQVERYRSAREAQLRDISVLITDCDVLVGLTPPDVVHMLGGPASKTYGDQRQTWHYGAGRLAVRFSTDSAMQPIKVRSVSAGD